MQTIPQAEVAFTKSGPTSSPGGLLKMPNLSLQDPLLTNCPEHSRAH